MSSKVRNLLFFFFILFNLTSLDAEEKKSEDYEIYVDQIVRDFALEMKKEFDLVCIGSGGGMPHDVEEIDVSL